MGMGGTAWAMMKEGDGDEQKGDGDEGNSGEGENKGDV